MNETEIFNSLLNKSNKRPVDIARLLGVFPQKITEYKNGDKSMKLFKLHALAKKLNLKIDIKIT